MYRQQCRLLVFLKEKLIADLENSEKIFVYQRPERASDHEVVRLLGAIRRYGSSTLLCVRPQDEDHIAGTVDLVEDGLLIGYLDRFSKPNTTVPPAFDTWLKICLAADQLWAGQKSP